MISIDLQLLRTRNVESARAGNSCECLTIGIGSEFRA